MSLKEKYGKLFINALGIKLKPSQTIEYLENKFTDGFQIKENNSILLNAIYLKNIENNEIEGVICYSKLFTKRGLIIDLGIEIDNEIIKQSLKLLSKYKIIFEKIYYNEIIDYDLSLSFSSEVFCDEIVFKILNEELKAQTIYSNLFVINYVDNILSKLNIEKINCNTDVKSLIKMIEIIKI